MRRRQSWATRFAFLQSIDRFSEIVIVRRLGWWGQRTRCDLQSFDNIAAVAASPSVGNDFVFHRIDPWETCPDGAPALRSKRTRIM